MGFIDKLFNLKPKQNGAVTAATAASNGTVDLLGFVKFVVQSLVTESGDVAIETATEGDSGVIRITCAKDDIRKVIGKNGRTINAIRALVRGAGKRSNRPMNVIVCE